LEKTFGTESLGTKAFFFKGCVRDLTQQTLLDRGGSRPPLERFSYLLSEVARLLSRAVAFHRLPSGLFAQSGKFVFVETSFIFTKHVTCLLYIRRCDEH
jgi:hypothetical protein